MSTTVTGAAIANGQPELVATYKKKVILTDEQIKSLPSSYVEIVPAAGDGKMLVLVSATLNFKTVEGGGYENVNGYLFISYGDWDAEASGVQSMVGNDSFDAVAVLPLASKLYPNEPDWGDRLFSGFLSQKTLFNNSPLKLCCDISGNMTGGNSQNYLSVTVVYSIIDL